MDSLFGQYTGTAACYLAIWHIGFYHIVPLACIFFLKFIIIFKELKGELAEKDEASDTLPLAVGSLRWSQRAAQEGNKTGLVVKSIWSVLIRGFIILIWIT